MMASKDSLPADSEIDLNESCGKPCLSNMNPFCSALPEEIRCRLCSVAQEHHWPRGGFKTAALVEDQLCIIRQGAVAMQIVKFNDGPGMMAFVAYPGDVCNLQRFISDENRRTPGSHDTGYGTALMPSSACFIPIETMRELFFESPPFAFAMLDVATDHYRDSAVRLAHVGGLPVLDQIRWLKSDLERHGVDFSVITHEQIAEILGVNRVTVSKCIHEV